MCCSNGHAKNITRQAFRHACPAERQGMQAHPHHAPFCSVAEELA